MPLVATIDFFCLQVVHELGVQNTGTDNFSCGWTTDTTAPAFLPFSIEPGTGLAPVPAAGGLGISSLKRLVRHFLKVGLLESTRTV